MPLLVPERQIVAKKDLTHIVVCKSMRHAIFIIFAVLQRTGICQTM